MLKRKENKEESKKVEEKKVVSRNCQCGNILQIVEGGPLIVCPNCGNKHN